MAKDERMQDLMGWAMRERASGNQLQHFAEEIKLALVKATEQGWRLLNIGVHEKSQLQQIQQDKPLEGWMTIVIQDIQELSNLFYKCSFCLEVVDRTVLCVQFSVQALSNHQDVEWVNPNLLY